MTFDMAQYGGTRYRAPGISEAELIASYTRIEEARPCLCGGVVVAVPVDPAEGLARHQRTDQHREWSARVYG